MTTTLLPLNRRFTNGMKPFGDNDLRSRTMSFGAIVDGYNRLVVCSVQTNKISIQKTANEYVRRLHLIIKW